MTVLVDDDRIRIIRLTLGPWETNAYVVVCPETKTSLIIDGPAEANTIVNEVKGTNPKYILLTHNHLDHIGALSELRNKLKVPLACHSLDSSGIASAPEMALKGREELSLGSIEVKAVHTPGHTRGSLCFVIGGYLFSGDTLFPGGPGNTRSSGDFKEIIRSITQKVFALPDDTVVYPGHGEPTVLKKEKEEFGAFSSRPHSPDLHGDVLWASAH